MLYLPYIILSYFHISLIVTTYGLVRTTQIQNSWLFNRSELSESWASYQIRKIAGCACAGNAGNVFPRRRFQRKPLLSDPGMHHGTCVTHVSWCMSGSLTRGDGENVPGIPGACAPAILRIWQEAHCWDEVYRPHWINVQKFKCYQIPWHQQVLNGTIHVSILPTVICQSSSQIILH